ncbi:MAG: GNAT family N-acetyltransferase [Gordonia sp. (in: high G+C Gram-positive bacteria)]|uniref:GNAT family N-acetyltransferase n=1 Tax=Gordonia sp. (in: high G+C Gram-positive bacteria) TaxID=84139 RepID=UPI0039E32EFF
MTGTLRTERLILRAPAEDDIDAIYRACQDPDIQRFTLVPVPYTRGDAEHFVRVTAAAPESVTRVITTRDGDFVGCIGVVERGDGEGSLGYWCTPAQRGRGYLSEALRAVVDDALSPQGQGLCWLSWSALPANEASARLAARAGFRYGGLRVHRNKGRDEVVATASLGVADDRTPQQWPPIRARSAKMWARSAGKWARSAKMWARSAIRRG